jgi:hypothetical protein
LNACSHADHDNFSVQTQRVKLTRSTAELNNDRHSSLFIAQHQRRAISKTKRSCGFAPSPVSDGQKQLFRSSSSCRSRSVWSGMQKFRARHLVGCAARCTEFISVSGQCAARSALFSDLRLKRNSGVVAATEHLRAPMNGPIDPNGRAGFSSFKFD